MPLSHAQRHQTRANSRASEIRKKETTRCVFSVPHRLFQARQALAIFIRKRHAMLFIHALAEVTISRAAVPCVSFLYCLFYLFLRLSDCGNSRFDLSRARTDRAVTFPQGARAVRNMAARAGGGMTSASRADDAAYCAVQKLAASSWPHWHISFLLCFSGATLPSRR